MKNLFVGNMSFQTTSADLKALFEPFGQLARVHVAMDRETGKARGFGFVEMVNDADAAAAIAALDGKDMGGRNIKVNEARRAAAARVVLAAVAAIAVATAAAIAAATAARAAKVAATKAAAVKAASQTKTTAK